MLTLYVKTGCPFCAKALRAVEKLGIEGRIIQKNIADAGIADELVAAGGKRQVPFLVDEERDESMYESDDIVNYLTQHYGNGEPESDSAEGSKQGGTCSI